MNSSARNQPVAEHASDEAATSGSEGSAAGGYNDTPCAVCEGGWGRYWWTVMTTHNAYVCEAHVRENRESAPQVPGESSRDEPSLTGQPRRGS